MAKTRIIIVNKTIQVHIIGSGAMLPLDVVLTNIQFDSSDDAEAAVRWVFNHTSQLGIDGDRIGLCGDSAGGQLAASTAFMLRR